VSIIKAKYVWMAPNPVVFGLALNIGPYYLAIHVLEWGVRIMLITHHLCWHWPERKVNRGELG
jgi:hypothetical protein